MISELKEQKAAIKAKIDELYEQLYEINVEIGKYEGYLAELRYIDREDC